MKKNHKNLSLALLIASTVILSPLTVDAKTIIWPDDHGQDPEAVLRGGYSTIADNSLYIDSSFSGNTITITAATGDIGGSVHGVYNFTNTAAGAQDATYNVVNMYCGTIGTDPNNNKFNQGYVDGGYSHYGNSKYNTVNFYGGNVKADISGGAIYNGTEASYNTINMYGGTVNNVHGAYVENANNTGAVASHNTVNLYAGTITGSICGGDANGGSGEYNTLNIYKDIVISSTASIYGVHTSNPSARYTDNTLNMNWSGSIMHLSKFEHLNFVVNDAVVANNNTILNINGVANITKAHIKITDFESTNQWQVGDKITILSKSYTDPVIGPDTDPHANDAILYGGHVQQGLARYMDYDMTSVGADNAIVAEIIGSGVNDDVGDIPSGGGATNELLKSAADLIDSADLIDEVDGQSKLIGIMKHSRNKIGSGSTVNVNGTAMLIGTSRKYDGKNGYVMLGGFVEAGWGNYDTTSNYSANTINSTGRSNYHGIGLAMSNIRNNGAYSKLTLRTGRAFTHYNSLNLSDSNNNLASYDTDSMYYGANISVGRVINLDDNNALDFYGKYLFLHQGGSSVTISGDKFDLDAINSHRLRAGAKITNKSNKNLNTYLDLAYEYEFAGQAKAITYGVELPYVSTKGGTAMAEVGVIYKPKNMDKFETRLGVQGYVGKRQGVSGNIEFKWKF